MKSQESKRVKHAIKWLADKPHPTVVKTYFKTAPTGVIKGVINAAANIQRGNGITLSPAQKKFFGRHRRVINFLSDRKVPFEKKKRAFQRGGFPFAAVAIPILSTVLGSLGAEFLPRLINKITGNS